MDAGHRFRPAPILVQSTIGRIDKSLRCKGMYFICAKQGSEQDGGVAAHGIAHRHDSGGAGFRDDFRECSSDLKGVVSNAGQPVLIPGLAHVADVDAMYGTVPSDIEKL